MLLLKFDLEEEKVNMLIKDKKLELSSIEGIIIGDRTIKAHAKILEFSNFVDKNTIFLTDKILAASYNISSLLNRDLLDAESLSTDRKEREVIMDEVRKRIKEETMGQYQLLGEAIRKRLNSNVVQASYAEDADQ